MLMHAYSMDSCDLCLYVVEIVAERERRNYRGVKIQIINLHELAVRYGQRVGTDWQ